MINLNRAYWRFCQERY